MSSAEAAKILVVDDEEPVLRILRKILEAEGLAVDVCSSARDALAHLLQNHYDAIISDMWMPGMTGKDFYYRLKDEFPEYTSRIIFLTGDVSSTATWDFIQERRLPYLLKPFHIAAVREAMRDLLGERAAPPKPADQRRYRRIAIKARVRVREKKWATRAPEIASVVNASKEGVCFLTQRRYGPGADVLVCFPYTGVNDIEQEGCVVRVQERPEGYYSVAIATGEAGRKARAKFAAQEDRRTSAVAPWSAAAEVPLPGLSQAEEQKLMQLRQKMVLEREEARRLAEELADLRETYERVSAQRDRLASQEAANSNRLEELAGAKASMAQVIGGLQGQLEKLQKDLAEGEAIRFQATHDSLTGVWNRAAILDILKRELSRAEREDIAVGILLLDLDHFKAVNDTHGHQAGDTVLHESARRMTTCVREYDSVGRYGGEEFLIVLVGCDTTTTLERAERIRARLSSEPVKTQQVSIPVTASLGAATSRNASEMHALIHAADVALYRAKRNGRDRVEMATAADAEARQG